jgi:hypothetical protein
MILALKKTFEIVRLRQDRVSRNNALRRDENQKRYEPVYSIDDPVLLWEPKAASSTGAYARPAITIKAAGEMHVPDKWRMSWSGPHTITSAREGSLYQIYHVDHRKHIKVNVDRLAMYHPFSDISDLFVQQDNTTGDSPSPAPPAHVGSTDINDLEKGDYCLVVVPGNQREPVAVMRYLSDLWDDSVEMQWLGTYNLYWYIDERMYNQGWHNSWYEAQSQRKQFYYKDSPTKRTKDVAFTNLLSKESICKKDIFLFGFKLMDDYRLPRHIADIALARYRELSFIDGESTYEFDKLTERTTAK